MSNKLSVLLLIGICWVFASNAYAASILDQAFTNVACTGCTAGLGLVLDAGYPFAGQTVTAGMTGYLTSVSIFADQAAGLTVPWIVDIVDAPGGTPDGKVLAVSNPFVLPVNFSWTSISIPSAPFMNAGISFAIILQLAGVTAPVAPHLIAGAWAGAVFPTDPYAGGYPTYGLTLNSLTDQGNLDTGTGDLFFQTFVSSVSSVNPVPEPSIFVLTLTSLGVLVTGYSMHNVREKK